MTEMKKSNSIPSNNTYFYSKLHTHRRTREEMHRTFGGQIYASDFSDCRGKENVHGSSIASRIEADRKREDKLYKERRQSSYGINREHG